jgi:hypothetical protein
MHTTGGSPSVTDRHAVLYSCGSGECFFGGDFSTQVGNPEVTALTGGTVTSLVNVRLIGVRKVVKEAACETTEAHGNTGNGPAGLRSPKVGSIEPETVTYTEAIQGSCMLHEDFSSILVEFPHHWWPSALSFALSMPLLGFSFQQRGRSFGRVYMGHLRKFSDGIFCYFISRPLL